MSQNATTQQARTVNTIDRGKLDLKALTLYAILLAAGFVLNIDVYKRQAQTSSGAGRLTSTGSPAKVGSGLPSPW